MVTGTENIVDKWVREMQYYLDAETEKASSIMCLCGGKPYCGYCRFEEDKRERYVCAKAIIDYYKEKGIEIDYTKTDYAEFITRLLERYNENREQ